MPLYVYNCDDCDRQFEVFVRSRATRAPSACEHCGGKHISRQISGFAVAHSELDRLRSQDPQYKQMVEESVRETASYADPMRHLEKMIPFDAADDPGDPINF